MTDVGTTKRGLWERIFGARCEHDWFDKDMVRRGVKDEDGQWRVTHRIYIKECRKCQKIWQQSVP